MLSLYNKYLQGYVDIEKGNILEELLFTKDVGIKTGLAVANCVIENFREMDLDLSSCSKITTDGAPSMIVLEMGLYKKLKRLHLMLIAVIVTYIVKIWQVNDFARKA